MLTIRSTQLDTLAWSRLREHYPRWSQQLAGRLRHLEDEQLLRHIESAVVRARSLGIEEVRDLTAYLDLCADLGFDFDSRPECARVAAWLRDVRISSPSRRLQLARESHERAALTRAQNQLKRGAFEEK